MAYLADPGGKLASDTHRRVLGHLTNPDDDYAWSVPALLERMRPDVGTDLQSSEELQQVLKELEDEGYAESLQVGGNGVWRMTSEGLDILTGSIANEPPPGAEVQGPATIHVPGVAAATRLSEDSSSASETQEEEQ